MKAELLTVLVGAGLLVTTAPVFAHHSFAAEFDGAKTVHLEGTVTKLEWENPHIHFLMDAKGADGKVVNWDLEMGSPNALSRQGVSRHSMNPGDKIIVDGFRAKDGSNLASARTVTFSDGRKVFAGSADDGGPGSTSGKQ
jgi:hypothetical protein